MVAIPPIRPRQPRPTDPAAGGNVGPHSTAHPPGHARPTRPPTPGHPRSPATATTRPAPPTHAAANARPRPVGCPPSHRSPAHSTGGFCTIRRIVTARRRRVAPLMLQFPHSPGQERLPHRRRPRLQPWQAHPTPHRAQPPPHPRSDSTPRPRPRASQSPATTGGNFGLHPLFSQNEIRPTQFAQTVTY